MPLIPPQPHSIVQATADALSKLSTLSKEAQSHAESEDLKIVTTRYSDEIDRLEIWASEHDVRSGSLDYKLRDASILRKRVLSLLAQLSGTPDTKSSSDGEDSKVAGLETLVPVHLFVRKDDDEATSLSLDTDYTLPDSLSDSPLTHIHDVVNSLFGLGPTLLDPAPRDRVEWSDHKNAAHYDVDHVQARFPQAEQSLVERLGRANWEHRQYLSRLRSKLDEGSHDTSVLDQIRPINTRLEKRTLAWLASDTGVDTSGDDASDVDEVFMTISQAPGRDLDRKLPARGSRTVTTSQTQSEVQSSVVEDGTELTAITEPSKGVTRIEPTGVRYAIPAPPHPNEHFGGDEFLCPFCAHKVTDMTSPADWKWVHLCLEMIIRIDNCTGNTSSKICSHTLARIPTVCYQPRAMEVERRGGSTRRSVTGPTAHGSVPHVSEDISIRSSMIRPHSRSTSASTTLLGLRKYRCQTSETCARKMSLDNDLAKYALFATSPSRSRISRA
jgi:hypothetical protein